MKKILTIGGGTGQYHLLVSIREIEDVFPVAVVSMADSGGSSGRLRDEFGALPPGDALKSLLALTTYRGEQEKVIREFLHARFREGVFENHNSGNLLLTMLGQYSGSFPDAVSAFGESLKVHGRVLPATTGNITLRARLENGEEIIGETKIDVPENNNRSPIKEVWLEPNALAYQKVLEQINKADLIVIGPGDLYTSIIPVLLVRGIEKALRESKAKKIYICNIMTKNGETNNFKASDFLGEVEKYIKGEVDKVIINNAIPTEDALAPYKEEGSLLVEADLDGEKIIKADLLSSSGDLLRHDPDKLRTVIKELL